MTDTTTTMKHPPGTVILFTSGVYSDYRQCGEVVTVKECHLPTLAKQFWAEALVKGAEPQLDDFPSWLVVKGYVVPLACSEVHLGDYGNFDPEFGVSS